MNRCRIDHRAPGRRRWVCASITLLGALWLAVLPHAQAPARRIVTLIPALTEMLFAIGAGPQVVAVSSYDEDPPEVRALPRVGALLDPDVERILSLRPDLVLVYGSQTDLMAQLARAAVPVFEYRHGGLSTVTSTIRALGQATGRVDAATTLAAQIDRRLTALRARTTARQKPRTLLVFGRERGSLRHVYASGGRGFLHDMLEAAGGVNVFADVPLEAVQASTEMLLTRRPDVILELRASDTFTTAQLNAERQVWAALASVPAVRRGRIEILTGRHLVVPGPRVADAAEAFARALGHE